MEPFIPDELPLQSLDWGRFVTLISEANREIGTYNGLLKSLHNPRLLTAPLLTQEAVSSSRIEGSQATLSEVEEFEATKKALPQRQDDIQEVINYRNAMHAAVDGLQERPLSLNLIRRMHAILLDSARGRNRAPGEFRRIQNYIAPHGVPIEKATYVPPPPNRLMEYLSVWEKYLHVDEQDPLVQLAIVHAQFEIIHPFLDGNGRLGRILIPLFLYEKKVLTYPAFHISGYFEQHLEAYYQYLNGISRNNQWNEWIEFLLLAIIAQARLNNAKVESIHALFNRLKELFRSEIHSQNAIGFVDALFHSSIFSSIDFQHRSHSSRANSSRVLKELQQRGILEIFEQGKGQAPTVYLFTDLFNITDR